MCHCLRTRLGIEDGDCGRCVKQKILREKVRPLVHAQLPVLPGHQKLVVACSGREAEVSVCQASHCIKRARRVLLTGSVATSRAARDSIYQYTTVAVQVSEPHARGEGAQRGDGVVPRVEPDLAAPRLLVGSELWGKCPRACGTLQSNFSSW